MDTEDLLVDECSQWKEVHDLRAVAPHIHRAILAQAFIIETIHLGDLTTLMIASNQGNVLGVPNLEGEKEQECLN